MEMTEESIDAGRSTTIEGWVAESNRNSEDWVRKQGNDGVTSASSASTISISTETEKTPGRKLNVWEVVVQFFGRWR